jgi:hypothetical protein
MPFPNHNSPFHHSRPHLGQTLLQPPQFITSSLQANSKSHSNNHRCPKSPPLWLYLQAASQQAAPMMTSPPSTHHGTVPSHQPRSALLPPLPPRRNSTAVNPCSLTVDPAGTPTSIQSFSARAASSHQICKEPRPPLRSL